MKKALEKQFAPEFMNRLDNIVYFDHLSQEDLLRIVDIELKPLFERVNEMGHTLEVTPETRELLGKKGYDIQFGARPLKRAIQDLLEDPLCELLMEEEAESSLQLKAIADENGNCQIVKL